MGKYRTADRRRFAGSFAAVALAAAMAMVMCLPTPALAYFSKSPVGIHFGSSHVSLTTGTSSSVGLTVDPMQEQQLPGCGMAICPEACGGLENPVTGVVGGCLNDAGWCTCAGTTYYTAYTNVSVSSSNPYVARASYSGGALSIQAVSTGTATITVYASLSKHQDASASMTVQVSDPAPSTPSGGGSTGGSGSATGGSGGSGSSATSGSGSGSGSVSVSSSGASVVAAAAAAAGQGDGSEAQEVVELETAEGDKIIVVEATDSQTAAEELAKIAGTNGTCTFWSGGTMDSPSISWTFKGQDLDPNGNLSFDPGVTVSNKGTGAVAELLDEAQDAIVMDFAHTGNLPGPAEVYVRASGVYADGDQLTLFLYNEDTHKFEQVQEGVAVSSGYAVFTMDHCSTWALSTEDLASFELTADEEAAAEQADLDATTVDIHSQDGTMWVIVGVVAAVVIVAGVAAFVVARRRKTAAVSAGVDAGSAESVAEGAASEGEGVFQAAVEGGSEAAAADDAPVAEEASDAPVVGAPESSNSDEKQN